MSTKWIASYLSQRPFHTVHNNNRSDKLWLLKGVPQGSALSPLLFSVYINPLLDVLSGSPALKVQAYADGIILTSTDVSTERCVVRLEKGLAVFK